MKLLLLLCSTLFVASTLVLADTVPTQTGPSPLLTYLQADKLQTAGLTGKNIKIGIISDGVQNLSQFVQAGILPDVGLVDDAQGSGQNGIGMLQVVHILAPDARLYFCAIPPPSPATPESVAPVATCLGKLITQFGVTVVGTDIVNQQVFHSTQDTLQTEALLEANPDILLLSGAGEQGKNYYQAAFTPVTLSLPTSGNIPAGQYSVQDFGASVGQPSDPTELVVVPPGMALNVCWSVSGAPPAAANETNTSNNQIAIWYLDNSGQPIFASEGYLHGCDSQAVVNTETMTEPVRIVFGIVKQNAATGFSMSLSASLSEASSSNANTQPTTAQIMHYVSSGGAGGTIGLAGRSVIIGSSALGTDFMDVYSQSGPLQDFYSTTALGTINSGGYPEYLYTRLATPKLAEAPALTGADTIPAYLLQGYQNSLYSGDGPSVASVAAVAAQLMQAGLDRDQVVSDLEQSAVPLLADQQGNPITQTQGTWNSADGYGLVQGYAALKQSGLAIPQPVITSPSGSITVNVGEPVNFAGNCTVSNGASITAYEWDIEQNGTSQGTSDAQNPGNLTLQNSGLYQVTFNCTASNGLMSGEPAQVSILVNGPSSSGGGGIGWLVLIGLGICLVIRVCVQQHRFIRL